MEIFVILFLMLLGVVIVAGIPCFFIWRFTPRWPLLLRLLPISLLLALTITPGIVVGHGFAVVPVLVVLFSGTADEFHRGVLWLLTVWAAIYIITLITALLRLRALRRKDTHAA